MGVVTSALARGEAPTDTSRRGLSGVNPLGRQRSTTVDRACDEAEHISCFQLILGRVEAVTLDPLLHRLVPDERDRLGHLVLDQICEGRFVPGRAATS